MGNNEFKSNTIALDNLFKAMKELREFDVLINQKDFTCQIGEWLVEELYEGKRAVSGIQKGWDVEVKGKHIQVKTHAKAETNRSAFSAVDKHSEEKIDELIIIVFTFSYKLKTFYKVPWTMAVSLITSSGKKNPRNIINWSSIKQYRIEINELPHQEIVSLFK